MMSNHLSPFDRVFGFLLCGKTHTLFFLKSRTINELWTFRLRWQWRRWYAESASKLQVYEGDKTFSTFKIHECIHLSAGVTRMEWHHKKITTLTFLCRFWAMGREEEKRNMENGKKIIFHLLTFFFSRTEHMVEFVAGKGRLIDWKMFRSYVEFYSSGRKENSFEKIYIYPSNIFSKSFLIFIQDDIFHFS